MTRADRAALRFLVEEFIAVDDRLAVPDDPESRAARGVIQFQRAAARRLLPGPQTEPAALSVQQLALTSLSLAHFQDLRRAVRDWLRSVMTSSSGHPHTLRGPLRMWLYPAMSPARVQRGMPRVEGAPRDVFWFYVFHLVGRVGLAHLGVCWASRSARQGHGWSVPEPCERIFVRRGRAKAYCSEQCRARAATQRAREGDAL